MFIIRSNKCDAFATHLRRKTEKMKREILIKKGRTGKGVYYTLNPIYKGDIRGHKWVINGSVRQRGASLIINSNLLLSVNPEMFEEKYVCKERGCLL